MAETTPEPMGHWTVDRRIPVALFVAMIAQTLPIVWWAAQISSQQHNLEIRVLAQETKVTNLEGSVNVAAVSLGRIEENVAETRRDIADLVRALETRFVLP